jgi:glycosyltransferase involved in cell wall biosynthesis
MDKLYIVIPAYNEEANIETVTREWHDVVVKVNENSRIVIIDDGSKDSTYEKIKALRMELPQLEAITKSNGGHGAAILCGYRHALDNGADYVFQTDSDGQTLPVEFWQFWENRKEWDFFFFYRKNRQDGFLRVFVTKVLKFVLRLCFHVWVDDANTPFRLMNADTLKHCLAPIPDGYFLANVALSVIYKRWNYKIKYIPITFKTRQGGKNSLNFRKIFFIGKKAISDFRKINLNL